MPDETAAPATTAEASTTTVAPASAAAAEPEARESLTDFCKRISRTDRRVELIAAFFHQMTLDKKKFDTVANWRAALDTFATSPA